ncbi:MAG: hypothetical protein AAF547_02680 [Actinomycetota bacterium]
MTSPADVAAFHREFDRHPDDRVRLFAAFRELLPADASVLYPGSYVDIGPSVWFDRVIYVDIDKRAARFFAEADQVDELVTTKRQAFDRADRPGAGGPPVVTFHHLDYRDDLPIGERSVDAVVSLYAGFISSYCTRYLRPGGLLLANNSHGDASMASLDPDYELAAVLDHAGGRYRVITTGLDPYLQPKRGEAPTAEELQSLGRGIAYTRSAFAYVFRRNHVGAG